MREFPSNPVVKSPPSNAGVTGSIPGRGTKIPHAVGQLSNATTEPAHSRAQVSLRVTTREPSCHNKDPAQSKNQHWP